MTEKKNQTEHWRNRVPSHYREEKKIDQIEIEITTESENELRWCHRMDAVKWIAFVHSLTIADLNECHCFDLIGPLLFACNNCLTFSLPMLVVVKIQPWEFCVNFWMRKWFTTTENDSIVWWFSWYVHVSVELDQSYLLVHRWNERSIELLCDRFHGNQVKHVVTYRIDWVRILRNDSLTNTLIKWYIWLSVN